VNQQGERQTLENFKNEDDFWEINTLSVIIPASERDFVKSIQDEIAQGIGLQDDIYTYSY
jgi:restriction endonuclease